MRLFDYIQQGGPIMYVLLILNIIGFALLFWKTFMVVDARKNFKGNLSLLKEKVADIISQKDPAVAMNILKDEVQLSVHSLESGLKN